MKPRMRIGALSDPQVAHMGMDSEPLYDETTSAEVGCRPAREVPGGLFLSVFSEICTRLA